MFKKILIANRGEIACRVIRTAQRMGIRTVAVYSDADARALHTDMADEKVAIGPAQAAQSYLAIEKIVEACRLTEAEAVHPGYGFLSERSAFPRALADAGIVFIGPHAGAIDAMGDKIESKRAAIAAGVSTVPGHLGAIEDEAEAVRLAGKVGYPVMIKASAGGGGKGMRIAHDPAEVRDGFARARSEARSSFGDDRVFIEKYISNPRHIEIQVLGDKHGHVIHLSERECSIQRRNQKVIEETPSPLIDANIRKAMGEQAVALAKAVKYDSAGTVEFVAAQDSSFYFLEMNTRLQVEHPVTELVTGVDLVEQMIRIAAGEKLYIRQADVKLDGWAIETRVYAEDPYRNFLPSTGRLIKYRPPPEEQGSDLTLRIDTSVYEGGEIPIHYDPMIAKLCVHAPTRERATAAMAQALDSFYIGGIRHNVPFLAAIINSERWQSGRLSTNFIGEEFPEGFHGAELTPAILERLKVVAAVLDHTDDRRRRQIAGQLPATPVASRRERIVKLGGSWASVEVSWDTIEEIRVKPEGAAAAHRARSEWRPGQPVWHGTIDGETVSVQVERITNGYRLGHRGVTLETHVYTRREAELVRLMPERTTANGSSRLLCPMPGLVVSINVAAGQEVKAGETLAIVEAMKMENVLRAERDAVVKQVLVKTGDSLTVDAVMMEFA